MMTKNISIEGDIVFVVERTNVFIGVVTKVDKDVSGDNKEDMINIEPMYMKIKVNTNSIWTERKNIKAFFGRDREKALIEYAEYFI